MPIDGRPAAESPEITVVKVAVIGLGYVGLPLALLMVEKGFTVIGVDLDAQKIERIARGASYLPDVLDEELAAATGTGRFTVSTSYDPVHSADAVVMCVPTPLTSYHTPDLSYLQRAALETSRQLRYGQIVMLESSTYPGTTREVFTPLLEQESKLKAGRDFHVGYSPERINPGSNEYGVSQIPKVISGLTEACAAKVEAFYSRVFERVVTCSSVEVAEMAKLLENSQRFINISFANELALLCDEMQIDFWEVIAAAGTKPFGFAAYYPGPGIGGHCIPVDPLYLQWKAKSFGLTSKFVEVSDQLNRMLPGRIAARIKELLSTKKKAETPLILLYGVAYKKDINDMRESAAVPLIERLEQNGAKVIYHDPHIPEFKLGDRVLRSVELTDDLLRNADCTVIVTDHTGIPVERIVANAPLVFDTRNATQKLKHHKHVFRLGGGGPA